MGDATGLAAVLDSTNQTINFYGLGVYGLGVACDEGNLQGCTPYSVWVTTLILVDLPDRCSWKADTDYFEVKDPIVLLETEPSLSRRRCNAYSLSLDFVF
ncbi:hypothetical protein WH50_05340 [Pokkaliibacter plantistimulans]|uniref:Uncharacterized protein n=2 Tax=Pokkaliibacter plantistimulans TaxID=1635171 RepID=A0ABX5M2Z8_9GAMM|nr:hypothetical protein WH50_05340 [Pokkaliibacter plantistimulans]